MFGAVYIGTYDVSLKVFEFRDKKRLHEVDYVRARHELGRHEIGDDRISFGQVDALCVTLSEFKQIMEGYRVTDYAVYASASIRDASNKVFVLDQIYLRTGMKVKIISNSEHRFISYKSIAGRNKSFEKLIKTSAALVGVGGASIQITIFRGGKLITTQHIDEGIMRLSNLFDNRGETLQTYETQLEEYMNKKLEGFRRMYLSEGVDSVIFFSDYAAELIQVIGDPEPDQERGQVKTEKFLKMINKLQKRTVEEITTALNLANEREPLIIPAIITFKTIIQTICPKSVWVPGANMPDGMAYDYAQRHKLMSATHDFDADVLSAATYLSEHYYSYSPHIEALSTLSVQIFDAMKKVHGLGKREKLLLQVATILHDCGKYVSLTDSAIAGYNIILSSEILGLTHREREIVAQVVRCNKMQLEPYDEVADRLEREDYLIVAKLTAILRVANALDQSHKQKFQNIRIAVRDRHLVITLEAFEDIALEQELFEQKTSYFENVYSLKPILKEKRVYKY
jgi:exopolyphosphatase/guanosine-5'-triphosphate,3'-diphosphate pyrophosphatase